MCARDAVGQHSHAASDDEDDADEEAARALRRTRMHRRRREKAVHVRGAVTGEEEKGGETQEGERGVLATRTNQRGTCAPGWQQPRAGQIHCLVADADAGSESIELKCTRRLADACRLRLG